MAKFVSSYIKIASYVLFLALLGANITQALHLACTSQTVSKLDANRDSVASVQIYYEALCPDCHTLMKDSLRKIWDDVEMRGRVNITLHPFGNAQIIDRSDISVGYQFWHADQKYPLVVCQHGESECLGNKIQACAMDFLGKQELYMPFVLCMASYNTTLSVESTSYKCGTALGISMTELKRCTHSDRGQELILSHGVASSPKTLGRGWVPWVVINGKHYEEADKNNLVHVLCSVLSPKPKLCEGTSFALRSLLAGTDKAHEKQFQPCMTDA